MLRHQHITHDDETVTQPRCFQYAKEEIAALRCAQPRLATITTAGDEVQVLVAVETVETLGHVFRVESSSVEVCDG